MPRVSKRAFALVLNASLGVVATPLARAADASGNYGIWGQGQASCHQFTTTTDDAARREFKAFIAGYLTSFNRVTPGIHQITGQRSMQDNVATITAYCGEHPMDSVDQALQFLIGTAIEENRRAGGKASWGRVPQQQTPKQP